MLAKFIIIIIMTRSDQPKPPTVAIVRQNGLSSASSRASVADTPVSRQIWWTQVVDVSDIRGTVSNTVCRIVKALVLLHRYVAASSFHKSSLMSGGGNAPPAANAIDSIRAAQCSAVHWHAIRALFSVHGRGRSLLCRLIVRRVFLSLSFAAGRRVGGRGRRVKDRVGRPSHLTSRPREYRANVIYYLTAQLL